jgi:3-phosphoshikimate 1-carboxyvinyltransferase
MERPTKMPEVRVFDLPTDPFSAEVAVPGDKSLSHRALILAAMAIGQSRVDNLPGGADVASTVSALRALGVDVDAASVRSGGIKNWRPPGLPIDCGNSGSTMRMLSGALAGSRITAELVGDASLMRRPMRRLIPPLATLGADIEVSSDGLPPVRVAGTRLTGAAVDIPIASAQLRTAVAFAALNADGDTSIHSPPGFRDHTERWLAAAGRGASIDAETFVVRPGPIAPIDVAIPGDPSSAGFLWVAAAVRPGAVVITPGVSLNQGRTGLLDVLRLMGADVNVEETGSILGDPIGTVTIGGQGLVAIEIHPPLTVRALDELPLVAVLGAAAEGTTVVTGAAELRVKETDRISASVELARAAGGSASASDDGFSVSPDGGDLDTVDAQGDHRIAMAAATAALVRKAPVGVLGFGAADVSWPGFGEVLEALWS